MFLKNWCNNNRWYWRFRFSHVNVIEYSSNYSETIGNLWFYWKDEATNLNADIANTNNFQSFEYKAKLLGNTDADENNGILKNATIAVLLKYFSNFWSSLEMP